MEAEKQNIQITGLELRIGIAIMVCLVMCGLAQKIGWEIQKLAACTGAVMCVQVNALESAKAGWSRMLGVICGGVVGIAVVFIDNLLPVPAVFVLLCGVGVVINLLLCKTVKLPPIAGRVSCMSFLLVVLVLQGTMRIQYAIGRFIGTLCGAVIAVLVTYACGLIAQKRVKGSRASVTTQ